MQVMTFAAIEIGSYSVGMEIFEISRKQGIRRIDSIRQRLELGRDTFTSGKISAAQVEELCRIMKEFVQIMDGYKTGGYRAVGTSALREAANNLFIVSRIKQQTGLVVELLSNSEQRFYGYKAIAAREAAFQKIIEKGTAIVDIDGGSVQVSLYDKDTLVTTQNIRLGNMRIRERLRELEKQTTHYEQLVEELIQHEISGFKKMYLKERKIENVILVGDYFTNRLLESGGAAHNRVFSKETFVAWYEKLMGGSTMELAVKMGIPSEYATLLKPGMIIYRRLIDEMEANTVWTPGVRLSDGLAYDFGEKEGFIKSAHNFENDIMMAAKNIGKRYAVNKAHVALVDMVAAAIFNGMKKIHGLGNREQLLLRIAVLLHDCGKYISMSNVGECSYNVIMSTEMIGLSHVEREMIANIVKYNTSRFPQYESFCRNSSLDKQQYLTVAKLTAMLRLANAMDRSHLQKVENIKAAVKDSQLVLAIQTRRDFILETGLLTEKLDFFEEVFSIRPVLKTKIIN